MKLTVFSHKLCWPSSGSPSGYATDGGFPIQMRALSELFDQTTLVLPCSTTAKGGGDAPLTGANLGVKPLTDPAGSDLRRKLSIPLWLLRNGGKLVSEAWKADAIHAPVPGDIGTLGMILAFLLRKPLFVRHCGNWLVQETAAEHFWKWFMERRAGGRNIMLATGGSDQPPSRRNLMVRWIFSTSLTEKELVRGRPRLLPNSRGRLRLVIACRQEKEKGTGVVIGSLPLLAERYPGVSFDVIGDGGSLPEFKKLAESTGVGGRVTFHGKVNHETVLRLLGESDVFCFPTTSSEGFPKAVLEALACGLPVVTTKVSVLPQLIGSGCGVLIDEATPQALARAVVACVEDSNQYRLMSEKSLSTARNFSLERWRDTIGDLLRSAWGPLKADG